MAQGKRADRLAELIRVELANAILNRLNDPRLGFATVVSVEMSPDLKYAKVYVSVMGSDKEKKSTFIALKRARGFLQSIIADVLKMRFTPHLDFVQDESIDKGMQIDTILKQIHEEELPKEAATEDGIEADPEDGNE